MRRFFLPLWGPTDTGFGQIIPWLNYSVPGVLNLAAITLTTVLAFYTFTMCVVSDPGSVPFDYVPDPELSGAVVEVKRKVGLPSLPPVAPAGLPCSSFSREWTQGRACMSVQGFGKAARTHTHTHTHTHSLSLSLTHTHSVCVCVRARARGCVC
jgi:hypothetical protein